MIKLLKEKKSFFDLNIFGLKISPIWGVIVGVFLCVLFLGSLLGSIGAIMAVIGVVKLINGYKK